LAEILTQQEIDALLSNVSDLIKTEPEEEKEVKATVQGKKISIYDFKRPERISKGQKRSLHFIHDRFARNFSSNLSAYLRTLAEVNMVSVEQLTYAEFLMSIPNPTSFNVLVLDNIGGNLVLEINPSLVFPIIDRLLGGEGIPLMVTRTMTEIEQNILKGVIILMIRDLNEIWRQIAGTKMNLTTMETNPQLVQIVPPNEVVILISFEVHIGEASGMMNLCIPSLTLEPLSSKFDQDLFSETKKALTKEQFAILQSFIQRIKLSIEAHVGTTTISAKDLMNLKVGDIVRLDNRIYEDIEIKIVGLPKFYGKVGLLHGNKAVQITGEYNPFDQNRYNVESNKKKASFKRSEIL
jgi:flagellar motor switch protein FliM